MTIDVSGLLLPDWESPTDLEEIIVAWLQPLRYTAIARQVDDPLPMALVTEVTGDEDDIIGIADPVVSVHTLCDRTLGYAAAKNEARNTHRRMLLLGRYLDAITLKDGRQAGVDYVSVFQRPRWVPYEDTQVLRKVGRYACGLSYVSAS